MREWLEWKRAEFVEYDVEADPEARRRMSGVAPGQRSVPLLVEDGKVVQVGWRGQSCMVEAETSAGGPPNPGLDGAPSNY
jgi:glutaredoxin 3